ncbi:MAG TPA: type II toxin-antitoxin system VapB family antitoxin, partial [Alphaproteobacteria bacterium]|nr:type II toxin-antitoxin system VapB family antitoxin [Alphaproteobacteria bacterium]
MALSIKDTKTDRLARKVARLAGESITEAVSRAL